MRVNTVLNRPVSETNATSIKQIRIISKDGTETAYDIDPNLHFLFGFLKVTPGKETETPIEIAVKGSVEHCGRLFFLIGDNHPDLVDYAVSTARLRDFEEEVAGLMNGTTTGRTH